MLDRLVRIPLRLQVGGLDGRAPVGDVPVQERRELALLLRLGPLLMLTTGLGSAQCERAYQRALALCKRVGTVSDSFIATFNMWFIAESQLRFDQATQHIDEALRLAQVSGDERFMVQARHAGYTTALITGDLARALNDAEDGYRRYRAIDGPYHCSTFAGHDPGLCSLGHQATALWLLGRPAEAYSRLAALQQLMAEIGHPPSQFIG